MDDYFKLYREMISLQGLTDHTITSYSTYILAYLQYLSDILLKSPEDVSWQEMRDFIKWLQHERSISDRTVNSAISQLRFFTLYVLHKPWDNTQLPMRKFDAFLPYVPSGEEAFSCIFSIPDLKEQVMVALMYSAGLRVGEVCSLRYEDIKRMRIHIRHSKKRSDRYSILSNRTLELLTRYWFECGCPSEWLFPGNNKNNTPYSATSFSNKFTRYRASLGWNPRLTCHSFRLAFGTQLYKNGAYQLTIKELMGHKSLDSTLIYVHLASNTTKNTVSPFDKLGGFHGQV